MDALTADFNSLMLGVPGLTVQQLASTSGSVAHTYYVPQAQYTPTWTARPAMPAQYVRVGASGAAEGNSSRRACAWRLLVHFTPCPDHAVACEHASC